MLQVSGPRPARRVMPLPPKREWVGQMLDRTGRSAVPIRRAFIQSPDKDEHGVQAGPLAELIRSRDKAALRAYLLIHAMASSSPPFDALYPVSSWVRALGLDEAAEPVSARGHWAKITQRLVQAGLIERERHGNRAAYRLLHESGSGAAYTRPRTKADERWFSLPYAFWGELHDDGLTLPEQAMLLISLDQRPPFTLPLERMPSWYGVSVSTSQRGLEGLRRKRLLTYDTKWRADPKSPIGWAEERGYSLLDPFKPSTIRAAARRRPVKAAPIFFEEDEQ